jgi:hypothetical protein
MGSSHATASFEITESTSVSIIPFIIELGTVSGIKRNSQMDILKSKLRKSRGRDQILVCLNVDFTIMRDSCEGIIKDNMKLCSDSLGGCVQNKGNKTRVKSRKSNIDTLATPWVPFWDFHARFAQLGFKDKHRATPDVTIGKDISSVHGSGSSSHFIG